MEVEAALPLSTIRLDNNLRRYAFRAKKLPKDHPIQLAIQKAQQPPPRKGQKKHRQLAVIAKSISSTTTANKEVI